MKRLSALGLPVICWQTRLLRVCTRFNSGPLVLLTRALRYGLTLWFEGGNVYDAVCMLYHDCILA